MNKKFVLYIVVALIFLGMVGFGVTQYVTSYGGTNSNNPISVGNLSVSSQILLQQYNTELQKNMDKVANNPYLQNTLLQNIIYQNVTSLLFVNEANSLNIGSNEQIIYNVIAKNPQFQNQDGSFDKTKFHDLIAQAYGSEEIFNQVMQRNLKVSQVLPSIIGSLYASTSINASIINALNQIRTIEYVRFNKKSVKLSSEPTNKELQTIYQNNQKQYTTPEHRKVEILSINVMEALPKPKVSDKEAQSYYLKNTSNYFGPQTIDISQILVDSKSKADKIYQQVKNDKSLVSTKEYQVTSIKDVNKTDLPQSISNTVFQAKTNMVLQPLKSSLGFHIIVVNKINKPKLLPFAQVKKQVVEIIKGQKMANSYEQLRNSLSQKAQSGASLKDIQKDFKGSTYTLYNYVTSDGLDEHGNVIKGDISNPNVLSNTFQLPTNGVSSLINVDSNMVLTKVDNITPSKVKPFKTVYQSLKDIWISSKQEDYINKQAEKLVAYYSQHNTFSDSNKTKTITLNRTRKSNPNNIFGDEAINNIFIAPISSPISGTLANGDVFVAVVKSITSSNKNKMSTDEAKQVTEYVDNTYKQNILEVLVSKLKVKYKISIDQKSILKNFTDDSK